MKLIQFNAEGCFRDSTHEAGISPSQVKSLRDPMLRIRDQIVADADQQPQSSFLRLPKRIHEAYESQRGDSELGRIFRVANGLHDEIDAVIVLGGESVLAARALMQACCDPLQNELDRAGRGSKPRMYFAGNRFDNDRLSSLLHHIRRTDHGSTKIDSRWALIVVDAVKQRSETMYAFAHFLDAMDETRVDQANAMRGRLLLPITRQGTALDQWANESGCSDVFSAYEQIDDRFGALSPATLLPAAMLGLDCMRLLGGAHAITQHFAEASFNDNIALQMAAVSHLHPAGNRLQVWNQSLTGFLKWNQRVQSQQGQQLVHNVIVETDRWTNLSFPESQKDNPVFGDLPEKDMRGLLDQQIAEANESHNAAARSTTQLRLPGTDIFSLGQLFQLLMLQGLIATQLAD